MLYAVILITFGIAEAAQALFFMNLFSCQEELDKFVRSEGFKLRHSHRFQTWTFEDGSNETVMLALLELLEKSNPEVLSEEFAQEVLELVDAEGSGWTKHRGESYATAWMPEKAQYDEDGKLLKGEFRVFGLGELVPEVSKS